MGTSAVTITPDAPPVVTITPDPPKPSLIDRGNALVAKSLSAAGAPTSVSDIPNWFSHFIGAASDSKPAWESFKKAVENPTQENIVGAVPFIGPASVAMSQDAKKGDYLGALATLGGTVGGAAMGGEVAPGARAAKAELVAAKDTISNIAKVAAPHSMTAGLVDALVPDATPPPKVHGAYSDFEGESGKPVPVSKSPVPGGYTGPAGVRAAQKAAEKAAETADISPIAKPSGKLSDLSSSEGRPATWTNDTVRRLAAWGDADAIEQARLRGFGTVPKNYSSVELNPKSVTKFDAQGNPVNEGESSFRAGTDTAYRVRNQGEEGVPIGEGNKGAHATTTLEDAQRLKPGRESVAGEPQEIVKYDLSKLKEGTDYVRVPRPGQPDWIRMLRPLKESEVQMVKPQ
jgi:hypothetical protein